MNTIFPASKSLKCMSYDKATQRLTVTFRNGTVYTYFGVSANRHTKLREARSAGAYFNKTIRHSYRFEKHQPEFDKLNKMLARKEIF